MQPWIGGSPDESHPVSIFLGKLLHSPSLMAMLRNDSQVLNNNINRELAVQMLIRMVATNLISNEDDLTLAWGMTIVILVLENYDETIGISDAMNYGLARYNRIVTTKSRDLGETAITKSRRDVLKFYRKRMNCSCLKKMHLEARKNKPKMGLCWHCGEEMERVHLYVCSQCTTRQYCSRECQVANWSKHKIDCGIFSQPKYQPEKKGEGHGNAE